MKLNFLDALEQQFEMHKNTFYAKKMEKLMKHNHSFVGIKNHLRLRILKYLYPDFETEITNNLVSIIKELFKKDEREYHYIALDLLKRNINLLHKVEYFAFIKNLLDEKADWDTIDILSKDVLGNYLLHFPELKQAMINLLINSGNVWKIRAAILLQLNYKEKTNKNLLFLICDKFIHTNDNLIYNAIVWALNEYKKTDALAVNQYITKTGFIPMFRSSSVKEIEFLNQLLLETQTKKEVSV